VSGLGTCNFLPQADENARVSASEQLVASLAKSGSVLRASSDWAHLREYVDEYATRTQTQTGEAIRSTASLSPTFTNAKTLSAFMRGRPNVPQSSRQRVQSTAVVPLSGGSVTLRSRNPKDGSFVFSFDVKPGQAGALLVSLRGVDVYEDGSVGSTSWGFQILSNGTPLINLPVQHWDDARRPTKCTIDAAAGFAGEIKGNGNGLALTITGWKG
jgi:hypothetical protein